MNITSDFSFELPSDKPELGSYEWWYFDAIDPSGHWKIVVIFYDGCPFSPAYNKKWAKNDKSALARNHPAISISLYQDAKPAFYCMSEYHAADCLFTSDENHQTINIKIGNNRLKLEKKGEQLIHQIDLNEIMPSGDGLYGRLTFESKHVPNLFPANKEAGNHNWNLTQPRASVNASLELKSASKSMQQVIWKGIGYHDHNTGHEPMKQTFTDWYWGRVHFESSSFIYYLMKTDAALSFNGWLLDANNTCIDTIKTGILSNTFSNVFNLTCSESIKLIGDHSEISIQQRDILDSGPFYYRFGSEFKLKMETKEERAIGITEYIYPSRIHWKFLWPLVHFRYHYVGRPHWVQKSGLLYPLTW